MYLKRAIRWAVAEQLVSGSVAWSVDALKGLPRGRTKAKESKRVTPVAVEHVEAVLPYCPPTLKAMIEVQLHTGMRSGELCRMRPVDIDRAADVWEYAPAKHKTAHLGHDKRIAIGPKAQAALEPFIGQPYKACFSPAQSDREFRAMKHARRKTPPNAGNRPGSNVKANPKRTPGDEWTPQSYARAVYRAIRRAQKDGVDVPAWTPHQLRHTRLDTVMRGQSLEAARAVAGHKTISVTSDYVERDWQLARAMAKQSG